MKIEELTRQYHKLNQDYLALENNFNYIKEPEKIDIVIGEMNLVRAKQNYILQKIKKICPHSSFNPNSQYYIC